jgi:hypothetical protein
MILDALARGTIQLFIHIGREQGIKSLASGSSFFYHHLYSVEVAELLSGSVQGDPYIVEGNAQHRRNLVVGEPVDLAQGEDLPVAVWELVDRTPHGGTYLG